MARFYADENFSFLVVEELRKLGHDVRTAEEAGRANQQIPDEYVLEDAANEERILITFDRDFRKMHRLQPLHRGIVLCSVDNDAIALAQRVHRKIEELGESVECQLLPIHLPNIQKKKGRAGN
ncbi:MAG: DUF5615 family PIN-like protein [Armatimonadetes bacterium]|nr:DUF5615 family PIN-like protein [Armatimonadota bacterium]